MAQAEQIAEAVSRSLASREAYTNLQVQNMFNALKESDIRVKVELMRIKERAIISKGLEVRRSQLKGIQREIDVITKDLRKDLSVVSRRGLNGGFQQGIQRSIHEFGDVGMPYYSALSHGEQVKLVGQIMSLIDRNALDFLVNFELQLLGNVTRELAEGIKQQISIGLITGESISKISEKIGGIIPDPEDFRQAGKTVFKTAQHRVETIARTETLRAYGQGRHKFYEQVGVKWVIWMAVGDKRMCPVCRELDGKRFKVGKAPGPPKHPQCRCTILVDPKSLGIKDKPVVVEKPKPKPKPKPKAKPKKPTCTKDMPPPEWFKEAKTIKEAEEFALENLCQKPKWVGQFDPKVDYSGISVDSANEVNRALAKLQSRGVPKVKQILVKSGEEMGDAAASMQNWHGLDQLRLDRRVFNTPEDFYEIYWDSNICDVDDFKKYKRLLKKEKKGVKLTTIEKQAKKELEEYGVYSRFNVGEDIEDIIQHEMGHHFHYTGNTSPLAENVVLPKTAISWESYISYLSENGMYSDKWGQIISRYAQENYFEFFAESFACYHQGEFKSVCPELLKLLDEFFEGK